MIFEEKHITLKDGRTAIFKSPCIGDAQKVLDYIIKACGETDYLSRYSEEWYITVEQEKEWIDSLCSSPNALDIACYIDGLVVGNCDISFGKGNQKTAHRATIGIAILKDYWNLGIGSAMFNELVTASYSYGIEIMELEFIGGNDRARHLYEKFGFKIVAEKPNAFKFKDGKYASEFHMQKYLI